MADNNQQLDKPPPLLPAQKEFEVILDLLKVPLRTNVSNQKLPPRRRWRGGCMLELPDLVPVPVEESGGFCRRNNAGQLVVKVENQGNVDAPECVTEVRFKGTEEPFILPTPAIPAGEARELEPLEIPQDCFVDNVCEFTITVDANNQVDELDKANNNVSGGCIGIDLELPDLVPLPGLESGEFCNITPDERKLVVKVENRGNVAAPECVTEVTFTGVEEQFPLPTPALGAGEARVLDPLDLPSGCFGAPNLPQGLCEFEIKVDANDEVVEANKENNTVTDTCFIEP
jgi:hypothetical protein